MILDARSAQCVVLLSLASCLEMTVEVEKDWHENHGGLVTWFSCHRVEKDWHENPEWSVALV